MTSYRARRVDLRSTRSYESPRGVERTRMRANGGLGVQMLAAVNGPGAYSANKKKSKKLRQKARKAQSRARKFRARSRSTRSSWSTRKRYSKKARKASKKARKHFDKAATRRQLKKIAHSVGMKRKELVAALKAQLAGTGAKVSDSGGKVSVSGGGSTVSAPSGFTVKDNVNFGSSKSDPPDYLAFNGRGGRKSRRRSSSKETTMAKRKSRRKGARSRAKRSGGARRTRAKRGRKSAKRRVSRGRKARKGRKAGKRRARKSGRKSSSRRKGRKSRGRFRRNGSDDDDDVSFTPNKRGSKKRGRKSGRKSWGKKGRKSSKRGRGGFGFDKKMLKELGIDEGDIGNPMQAMLADAFASRLSGEALQKALKKLNKSYNPGQYGTRRQVLKTEVLVDPVTGRTVKIKVPYTAKVRTAYGPFKRRVKGGELTYEYAKGKKIPTWALVGAPSKAYFEAHRGDYDAEFNAIQGARQGRRSDVAAKVARMVAKAAEKQDRILRGEDMYTPNRRGSKSRRKAGKRRSGKRAYWKKGLRAARKANKRRGRKSRRSSGKRRGRKSSKRRSSGRKRGRKSGKRRSAGRKRGRKAGKRRGGKGRSRKAGRRRGRGRFRRNASVGDVVSALRTAIAPAGGFLAHKVLRTFARDAFASQLGGLGVAAGPVVALLTGGLGIILASVVDPGGKGAAISVGMGVSVLTDIVASLAGPVAGGYLAGIPSVNTSGWGRRGAGSYELRGMGAYELRGLGASPRQAMAAYELRGLGGAPQQAMAGYAQALAGPGYSQALAGDGTSDGVLPSQSDYALDQADALSTVQGEYVNTQMRPGSPLFFEDPLGGLGVPAGQGGGVPQMSIWNPETVDQTTGAGAGGLFDDPNS